jgi:hypothetical protein
MNNSAIAIIGIMMAIFGLMVATFKVWSDRQFQQRQTQHRKQHLRGCMAAYFMGTGGSDVDECITLSFRMEIEYYWGADAANIWWRCNNPINNEEGMNSTMNYAQAIKWLDKYVPL